MDAWEAERTILATSLLDDAWNDLATTYAIILRTILVFKRAVEGGGALDDKTKEDILDTAKGLASTRKRLLAAKRHAD